MLIYLHNSSAVVAIERMRLVAEINSDKTAAAS